MMGHVDRQKPRKKGTTVYTQYIPTDEDRNRVVEYLAMGLKQTDVCRLLRISHHTMRRHYRYEMETGMNQQIAKVASTLFAIATNPDHPKVMSAATFFLKTRAGWRERIEITGPDGQPIQVDHKHQVVDSRTLTPEQRDNLREILTTIAEQKALIGPATVDAEYEDIEDGEDGEDRAEED